MRASRTPLSRGIRARRHEAAHAVVHVVAVVAAVVQVGLVGVGVQELLLGSSVLGNKVGVIVKVVRLKILVCGSAHGEHVCWGGW